MSCVVNVNYESRYIEYKFDFPNTENNLIGTFTADHDGQIFEVESTNVASYVIRDSQNNTASAPPFNLTAGAYYTVTIVKTTNGQAASISLRERRIVNKTKTYAVPDFGAYNGRYAYVVNSIGQVEKRDLSTRQPANYIGSGVWDNDNTVATITLPTPPTNGHWCSIEMIPIDGIEVLIVFGITYTGGSIQPQVFACKIVEDIAYSLSGTLNAYTSIFNFISASSADYRQSIYHTYDYIAKQLFLNVSVSDTSYYYKINLALANPTFLLMGTSGVDSINYIFSRANPYANKITIIPEDGFFLAEALLSPENNIKSTWIGNINFGAYDAENSQIIASPTGSIQSTLDRYTKQGTFVSRQGANPTIAATNDGFWNYSNFLKQGFCRATIAVGRYGIYDKTGNTFGIYALQNDAAAAGRIKHLACSNYAGLWIASKFVANFSTRMHFFKVGQTPPDFAYEDFANGIRSFITNQLNY